MECNEELLPYEKPTFPKQIIETMSILAGI